MSLGQNIYRLRTERKMSQEDFASAMEVSRQSVSKWENDSAVPELEKLIKMGKLFDISLDELVGNVPPQPKPESARVPLPAYGITTGDLVSVVLLILGIILPIVAICTTSLFNGLVFLIISLYITPALATIGAAYCSPNNKLLLRVYSVYDIIICIVGFWSMTGEPSLAFIGCFPTLAALMFWYSRMKG